MKLEGSAGGPRSRPDRLAEQESQRTAMGLERRGCRTQPWEGKLSRQGQVSLGRLSAVADSCVTTGGRSMILAKALASDLGCVS